MTSFGVICRNGHSNDLASFDAAEVKDLSVEQRTELRAAMGPPECGVCGVDVRGSRLVAVPSANGEREQP